MKRLAKLPTDRFIFPASEPMPEPQPRCDGWIVQQHEAVQIEHIEQPRPEADLMAGAARIIGAIALVLVAATILCQLTKNHEDLPVVTDPIMVSRVNWGAR